MTGPGIDSPARTEVIDQPAGGNRVAHFSLSVCRPRRFRLRSALRYGGWRRPPTWSKRKANLPEPRDGKFAHYLGPDQLVPTDGQILQVSAKVGEPDGSAYLQAQAIYDYVVANMKYDKSGTGWGRGDAIYACNVKKGNCTDFHSLFIAIARSRGIPARFTIGFPLGMAGLRRYSGIPLLGGILFGR